MQAEHGREARSQSASAGWFDRPMRWGQLTLAENDPGQFDPQFWLDYFRRTHCDAVCLSAGGIVCYYPTKIPLHHRSAWLGDADPFGDLVAGCRALGLVVIARTDPHAVRDDVCEAHPDWIQVEASGSRRRHWANPALWVTCPLGPYNFEYMTEVHREIMTLYRLDGLFANRWAGHGICYCEHCRRGFRDATGLDLPKAEHPADPSYRPYVQWRVGRLYDLWKRWDGVVREINPEARFIPNGFPDRRIAAQEADIFFVDHQGRSGQTPIWDNGLAAKQLRATMGRKPIVGIFNPGISSPYRWMDSVQSAAEVRVWVADGVAQGFRPWFTKFSATLRDTRWLETVESIYTWHHRAEPYLRNEESLARVGLVYSEQTERFYRGRPEHGEWHKLGMYHALVEARVPFDMVHDQFLDREHVDRYRLLILPNVAALSDEQCERLREYVGRGGSLIATFETSLYDEWATPRADFGLADLFGVSFEGKVEGPLRNSYLTINRDPLREEYHPILRGLEDAARIVNGLWRLAVTPRASFPSPLTLVPSYPDLPMEDLYPRVPRTEVREVYLRELGKSRVVYFPWDVDRAFYETMNVDHARLLRNAVEWALNEEGPVTVVGPGVVDVAIWRQRASLTVHLVNLTNPMLMKGPFRELIPIGAQVVRLRLPEGRRARRVQLLVSGETVDVREAAGQLVITVPSILDHEVVAVDLE